MIKFNEDEKFYREDNPYSNNPNGSYQLLNHNGIAFALRHLYKDNKKSNNSGTVLNNYSLNPGKNYKRKK